MAQQPPRPESQALEAALAPHGLSLRGAWRPGAQDRLPLLPDSGAPAVVWMVGQMGTQSWAPFKTSRFFGDGLPDPLDRWSQSIGDALAREFNGLAIYPFGGPPWHPFQQWAARAEALQASPLMLLVHPQYGLWHAYRFALALPEMTGGEAHDSWIPGQAGNGKYQAESDRSSLLGLSDICSNCDGQPCLHVCPVDAFNGTAFLVNQCAAHLHRSEGQSCIQQGCQARLACPLGAQHRYGPEQATFHMAAFAKLR